MLRKVAFSVVMIVGTVALGYAAGRIAPHRNAVFDKRDWPVHGKGRELIEFYDPACGASRAAHLQIELLEQKHEGAAFAHILVPVTLSPRPGATSPGEILCQLSDADAFTAALQSAQDGPRAVEQFQRGARSPRECEAAMVATAGQVAHMLGESQPSTPAFLLDGIPYRGLNSVTLISALVSGR